MNPKRPLDSNDDSKPLLQRMLEALNQQAQEESVADDFEDSKYEPNDTKVQRLNSKYISRCSNDFESIPEIFDDSDIEILSDGLFDLDNE